ncbi:hypothetical protein AYO44_17970 [Planctomycetaceae bacterium SCGC AG-212-F19]|nr:hypothetical protein AYO44_17970 [Planctomycetaceae bacterium SCGC AG-212-F19]
MTVAIEHTPKYEQIADQVLRMKDKGASIVTIAHTLGQTEETVRQAFAFARTGQRPIQKQHGKRRGVRQGPPKYVTLAPEVVRLREEQGLPFKRIARALGVSGNTVTRAYDFARPEATDEAAAHGCKPQRGSYSRLGPNKNEQIRAKLRAGDHPCEIATAVGCSASMVYRVRRSLECDSPA